MINYQWFTFDQLTRDQLYQLLQLRQQVFVVEQHCAYLDADGLDRQAWHLLGFGEKRQRPELLAYLRLLFAGTSFHEPAIGRLLTAQKIRGLGVGRELTRLAISHSALHYPEVSVRISAQLHLRTFYEESGFVADCKPYLEDGIPHIGMIRKHDTLSPSSSPDNS